MLKKKFHQNDMGHFWKMELTKAEIQRFMTDKGLFFVPKEINPPSCPQIRPIEQFWACLKQKVYANNWSASTRDQLISRIKKC